MHLGTDRHAYTKQARRLASGKASHEPPQATILILNINNHCRPASLGLHTHANINGVCTKLVNDSYHFLMTSQSRGFAHCEESLGRQIPTTMSFLLNLENTKLLLSR